ncbi:MAG: MFS transporter [Alphaproteobacteria bacterium]|nr:MFS transporter [Alphaproteobacteria bacterium]
MQLAAQALSWLEDSKQRPASKNGFEILAASQSPDPAKPAPPSVPARVQTPIYGAAFFSGSYSDVAAIVLPLWLASLGMDPLFIGLVIGAKHLLPLVFAIHGGALMDKLGARNVMAVCAVFSALAALAFPLTAWLPAILFLQMFNGFGSTLGFLGAQTAFAQYLYGAHVYAGRFSLTMRAGSLAGPPLAGLVWDHIGMGGGFAFLSLWAVGLIICAVALPPRPVDPAAPAVRFNRSDLIPKWSDYASTFRLAAIPAMAVMMAITVIRIAASSMQDSFYPLYLSTIGLTATQIGLLITISSAVAAVGALAVGPAVRWFNPMWLLIVSTFGAIGFVAATPLLTSFLALAIVAGLRGFCMGISQPLILSILVNVTGRGSQGKAIALRTTANRAAAGATPMLMGAIAASAGLAASFYITGVILFAAILVVCIIVLRRPDVTGE